MVPPGYIVDVFDTVVSPYLEEYCGQIPEVMEFLKYFKRTYIGGKIRKSRASQAPIFSHQLWNKYHQVKNDDILTNNIVEVIILSTFFK